MYAYSWMPRSLNNTISCATVLVKIQGAEDKLNGRILNYAQLTKCEEPMVRCCDLDMEAGILQVYAGHLLLWMHYSNDGLQDFHLEWSHEHSS